MSFKGALAGIILVSAVLVGAKVTERYAPARQAGLFSKPGRLFSNASSETTNPAYLGTVDSVIRVSEPGMSEVAILFISNDSDLRYVAVDSTICNAQKGDTVSFKIYSDSLVKVVPDGFDPHIFIAYRSQRC